MKDRLGLVRLDSIGNAGSELAPAGAAIPDMKVSVDDGPSIAGITGMHSEDHSLKVLESVSVVIPFTRQAVIGNAIASVRSQDYPERLVETIVVGKGSNELRGQYPHIIAIELPHRAAPGKARNIGAAQSRGDALLFLDDDCEAQAGWIRHNLEELQRSGVGAVSGKITGTSRAAYALCVDFANFGACQSDHRKAGRLWTATFGIRRDLFERMGGFDERVDVQEDIDICFRLNRAGFETVYQPKVQVQHNHGRTTFGSFIRYMHSGGRQAGLLVETRYPDLSIRNKVLAMVHNPVPYLLAIVPFAVAGTIMTVWTNLRRRPIVLPLAPMILVGKLAGQVGIWQWILGRSARSIPTLQGISRLFEYSLLKRRFRTPRILTLFVTSQCNAKCSHCFYWANLNQKHDMTFEELEELSDSLGKIDKLLVTGGEPFLRRDLAEICELFFRKNRLGAVSIPTNGLQPERTYSVVEKILEVASGRPVTISFSIDGTETYHDTLRGVPGNLRKLQQTYARVRSLQTRYPNLILRVATTLMSQNFGEVMKLFDELPEILPGVNSPCINLLRGSPHDRSLLLPSEEEIRQAFERKASKIPGNQDIFRRLADRLTFSAAYENLRQDTQVIPCEAGRILGVVEDNGDVKPCELLPAVGNLREGSFEQIWNSQEAREARARIAAKQCRCTHECNTFPSLMANPLHGIKLLNTAFRKQDPGS